MTKATPNNSLLASGWLATLKAVLVALLIGFALAGAIILAQIFQRVDVRSIYLGLDGLRTPILAASISLLLLAASVFYFRPRPRTLLTGFGVVSLCAYGIHSCVRIESFYGNMVPRLAWRWQPLPEAELGQYLSRVTLVSKRAVHTASSAPSVAATPNDHSGFLGSQRDGIVRGVSLQSDWVAHAPRELWRHPVGAGWAGFAIVGNAAITLEQRGANESIVCYHARTGEQLWNHEYEVRFVDEHGDGPRTTPTVSDGRVYCMGATGVLTCLDVATGELVWQQATLAQPETANLLWGMSGSPLVADGRVIVTPGGEAGRAIVAFDAADGSLAWSGGNDTAAYASPSIAKLAGVQQLLSFNGAGLRGFSENGAELWLHPWLTQGEKQRVNVAQPIVVAASPSESASSGYVLVSSGYDVGTALLKIERNQGNWTVSEAWKSRQLKSKMSNFVVHEGHIYGLDNGILACLELKDGQRKWKGGRYGHGQMLLVDKHLLIQSETGEIVLVDTNPNEHRELAKLAALNSKTWNHAALAGNLLIVRNDREAAAFELPTSPTPKLAR